MTMITDDARRPGDFVEPFTRALGVVALVLPVVGFVARWLDVAMAGMDSPTRLALGTSVPALAARGAVTLLMPLLLLSTVLVVAVGLNDPSKEAGKESRIENLPSWGFLIIAAVALGVSAWPGGTLGGMVGGVGGIVAARAAARARPTMSTFAPAIVVVVVGSVLASSTSPTYARASYYEMQEGALPSGWYVELGTGADGVYLHSCESDASEGYSIVPLGRLLGVTVDHSYAREHASVRLWEFVIQRRAVDWGLQFECPADDAPPPSASSDDSA